MPDAPIPTPGALAAAAADSPFSSVSALYEHGGLIMYFCTIASVLILALAMERWWAVFRAKFWLKRVEKKILEPLRKGNLEEARQGAEAIANPWRRIFVAGLDRALGVARGDIVQSMLREQKRSVATLRTLVWLLGSVGALLPFLGLFGTVVGVMRSFSSIATQAGGGFAVVSGGISEALIATAAGLGVALEAVFAFNYLQNAIGNVARELGLVVDESIEMMHASVKERELKKAAELLTPVSTPATPDAPAAPVAPAPTPTTISAHPTRIVEPTVAPPLGPIVEPSNGSR